MQVLVGRGELRSTNEANFELFARVENQNFRNKDDSQSALRSMIVTYDVKK